MRIVDRRDVVAHREQCCAGARSLPLERCLKVMAIVYSELVGAADEGAAGRANKANCERAFPIFACAGGSHGGADERRAADSQPPT